MSILSAPHFHDEAAAFERVEKVLWPQGPVCPHCGCTGRISAIKPNVAKRVRMGLKRCGDCKGQFTVRMGTIFEESKLPLHIWLQAMHLMASSKKGISAHQLHRTLEITYKSAWFLAHRIREAMVSRDARLIPDEAGTYKTLGPNSADHPSVNHSRGEYVSIQDPTIHTNTAEGFYSIFKRGMKGVYQHCSAKHLHRYVAEFDFRYSNRIAVGVDDQDRAARALAGVVGKRLTYRSTGVRAETA